MEKLKNLRGPVTNAFISGSLLVSVIMNNVPPQSMLVPPQPAPQPQPILSNSWKSWNKLLSHRIRKNESFLSHRF